MTIEATSWPAMKSATVVAEPSFGVAIRAERTKKAPMTPPHQVQAGSAATLRNAGAGRRRSSTARSIVNELTATEMRAP